MNINRIEIYCDVKDGSLSGFNRTKFKDDLKYFERSKIVLTIEKKKIKRSAEQNKYYWLCIGILSKELGYDKDEMHSIVKYKFLKSEIVCQKTGEVLEYIKSTAKLNKVEFIEFVDDMIRWASDIFGIILPYPHQ